MSRICASTWPSQTTSFPPAHQLCVSPTARHLKVSHHGPLMMVSLHPCLAIFAWLVVGSLALKIFVWSRCLKMGGFSGLATRSITQASPRLSVDAHPLTISGEHAFCRGGRFVIRLQMCDIVTLLISWRLKGKRCLLSQSVKRFCLISFSGECNSRKMARSK